MQQAFKVEPTARNDDAKSLVGLLVEEHETYTLGEVPRKDPVTSKCQKVSAKVLSHSHTSTSAGSMGEVAKWTAKS